MPTSFSRVDLPSPESLDLVMEAIKLHSGDLIRKQLELDGLAGEHEEAVCQRILETWLQSARQKLKSNLTIEGVNWREWEAQSQSKILTQYSFMRLHVLPADYFASGLDSTGSSGHSTFQSAEQPQSNG